MSGLRTFFRGSVAALTLAVAAVSVSPSARAASPYLEVVPPEEAMRSPAYRYANMTNEQAFAELDRRRILYSREPARVGVRAPIRLTGRLHGVHVHSSLPPEERPTTPFEVLDARLALAVDDFCAILAKHDVDELVHYTMYRPNVPPAGWSPPAQAKATDDDGAEKDRKPPSRAAKKRADAGKPDAPKSLGKGDKSGKPRASGRSRAGRKELGEAEGSLEPKDELEGEPTSEHEHTPDHDHTHDHAFEDEIGAALELAGAHHLGAKAAPAKPRTPPPTRGPGASAPAKSAPARDASAKPDAPAAARPGKVPSGKKPSRVASTGRRNPATLRRPPSREDGEELHTHRKPAPPGTRHPAGLAIDFGAVKKRDGRWLSVASHFRGRIGDRTCGVGAPVPEAADARELRAIVCEAREAGVFTYALTPNFDADHVDHVHFEIKPGVTWFLYH